MCVVDRHTHSARRTLLEISGGYGLILATIWSAPPARTIFAGLAAVWVLTVVLIGARRGAELGLGLRGLRDSLWALWIALGLVAVALLCAAALNTLHYHYVHQPYPPMTGYLVWSFAQQFILQDLFLSRLLRLLTRPAAAIGAAGLMMSMAHLPNLLLVITTLLWGVGACWLFFRYRNLYVVGAIHFLLGLTIAICVPTSIQHNMRVGRGYEQLRHAQLNLQRSPEKTLGVHTTLHSLAGRSGD